MPARRWAGAGRAALSISIPYHSTQRHAMAVFHTTITVRTRGQGLHDITESVARDVQRSKVQQGLVNIFCQHTSCSLVIMENADPSARTDLEGWLNRLVPENDRHFEHTM